MCNRTDNLNGPETDHGRQGVRRRGFTFTEVMFAVVILGIGLIMIAAVFPVAIRLNGETSEAVAGSSVAVKAMQSVRQIATSASFPPTYQYFTGATKLGNPAQYASNSYPPCIAIGETVLNDLAQTGCGPQSNTDATTTPPSPGTEISLAASQWATYRGGLVSPVDGRNGVAMAYSRSGVGGSGSVGPSVGSSSVKLFVVAAQVRGERSVFNDQDTTYTSTGTTPNTNDYQYWQKDSKIPADVGDTLRYPAGCEAVYTTGGMVASKYTSATPASLQLKRQGASFRYASTVGQPDSITLYNIGTGIGGSSRGGTGDITAATEGTFIIIARPAATGSTKDYAARATFNGTVFRLGKQVAAVPNKSITFELIQGQDVAALGYDAFRDGSIGSSTDKPRDNLCASDTATVIPNNPDFDVLFLGRMTVDSKVPFDATTNPYVGPAMDIAIYTSTITLTK